MLKMKRNIQEVNSIFPEDDRIVHLRPLETPGQFLGIWTLTLHPQLSGVPVPLADYQQSPQSRWTQQIGAAQDLEVFHRNQDQSTRMIEMTRGVRRPQIG